MLSSVTVIRAPAGPDGGAKTGAPGLAPGDAPGPAGAALAGAPVGGAPPPTAGEAAPSGSGGGPTGIEEGAICPSGTRRSTMFTPFCPSGPVSFSAACSLRTSTASRIVASRNSMCGRMMLLSFLLTSAVPATSLPAPAPAGAPVTPYFLTGCCHAPSTFQSWRARDSSYASSPY